MMHLSFILMVEPRDWAWPIWLTTLKGGWDFRLLCLCVRWEPA